MTAVMRCPKCKKVSGDDWSQCEGACPLTFSPDFDADTRARYGGLQKVEDEP
jgi:hypothetical protein